MFVLSWYLLLLTAYIWSVFFNNIWLNMDCSLASPIQARQNVSKMPLTLLVVYVKVLQLFTHTSNGQAMGRVIS